jgi:hypothetical protein
MHDSARLSFRRVGAVYGVNLIEEDWMGRFADENGRLNSRLNWIAICSYAGSLVLSLAIWRTLFRAVEHLMR